MSKSAKSKISSSLASSLEPVLREQTNNQLSDIHWFRTDWQRSGATTGFATWNSEDANDVPVVVKLPINKNELRWTRRMQNANGVAPTLFASDEKLNGYDLAWLIIERFPVGPLGAHWDDSNIERISESAALFSKFASEFPVDQKGRRENWKDLLEIAKKSIRENNLENKSRWKKAQSQLSKRLTGLLELWRGRRINQWLHGDVHLANAMCRTAEPNAPVSLIDLAEVHAGHWIEDAVYLERQLWGHKSRLKASRPVHAMAAARKKFGMQVDDNYHQLVEIRRLLLAATAPAFMQSEGDPRYLASCLSQFETALNRIQ